MRTTAAIWVAPPSRQGGGVAKRQEASSYADKCFGTGYVSHFGNERFHDQLTRHGAASCRCATRPVLRTRSGHPVHDLSPYDLFEAPAPLHCSSLSGLIDCECLIPPFKQGAPMSLTTRVRARPELIALIGLSCLAFRMICWDHFFAGKAPTNTTGPAGATSPDDLSVASGVSQTDSLVLEQPAADAVVAGRDFAVDLYQQLARERPGENLFFSPYSVAGVLTLAVEGARGETAAQMGKVLHFAEGARQIDDDSDMPPWKMDQVHSGISALNQRFRSRPVPQELRDQIAALRKRLDIAKQQASDLKAVWLKNLDAENDQATNREVVSWAQATERAEKLESDLKALLAKVDESEIRIANALWGDQACPFEASYMAAMLKYYGATAIFPVDFKNAAGAAREQINAWVEDQTNERIRNLIPPGGVDKWSRLVVTNAVYFKAEWQDPFLDWATQEADFTVAGGSIIRVPLMVVTLFDNGVRYAAFNGDGTYFSTPTEVPAREEPDPKTVYPGKGGFLMVELPYKGGKLSMVAIAPQEINGLDELEHKLTGDGLQEWIGKFQRRAVLVFLPKFKLETEYSLKPTLTALGMPRAFEKPTPIGGAQFEGICASTDPNKRLYIGEVRHKTFVEVNEQGTEATAATEIDVPLPGDFGDPIVPETVPFTPTFRADRPFLFLIRDTKTGAILFLGRLVRPQGEGL